MEALALEVSSLLFFYHFGALVELTLPTSSMASSEKLDEALLKLTNNQVSLGESMQSLTLKIDDLLHRMTLIISPIPSPSPMVPPSSSTPATQHRMKLEVPRFDGTELLGWISKINQYFDYHGTPEHDRLTVASFYMEGRALAWFQWMSGNDQFTS